MRQPWAILLRHLPRSSLSLPSPPITIMSDREAYDLRAKYTRFRILVIGRANAGKTTLLQRVCNTTEDPCIYDKNNKNLVSVYKPELEDEFCFWHFLLAQAYLSGTPLTIDIYYCAWPYHTARDTWHPPAVRIQEQPRIYLPRFSWIWDRRREAIAGSPVVYGGKSEGEKCRRSAACYLVGFAISLYILSTDVHFCGKGFVLFWTMLGLYYHWKRSSLRRRGQEKVSIAPSFKPQINILQCPSSQSLPSSMIWWLRSMISTKMTMSIAKMPRNKWKRSSENRCTGIPFHRVQMSVSKASVG